MAPEPPSRVGGARNEHGTRVAKRIVCTRCGAHDHVQWVEQDSKTALCKQCAEELLGVLELGRKSKQQTRDEICNLCGIPFAMPDHVEDDGDPLCGNCLRGFMAWQGTIDRTYDERLQEQSLSLRPGLRMRRRAHTGQVRRGEGVPQEDDDVTDDHVHDDHAHDDHAHDDTALQDEELASDDHGPEDRSEDTP